MCHLFHLQYIFFKVIILALLIFGTESLKETLISTYISIGIGGSIGNYTGYIISGSINQDAFRTLLQSTFNLYLDSEKTIYFPPWDSTRRSPGLRKKTHKILPEVHQDYKTCDGIPRFS